MVGILNQKQQEEQRRKKNMLAAKMRHIKSTMLNRSQNDGKKNDPKNESKIGNMFKIMSQPNLDLIKTVTLVENSSLKQESYINVNEVILNYEKIRISKGTSISNLKKQDYSDLFKGYEGNP